MTEFFIYQKNKDNQVYNNNIISFKNKNIFLLPKNRYRIL